MIERRGQLSWLEGATQQWLLKDKRHITDRHITDICDCFVILLECSSYSEDFVSVLSPKGVGDISMVRFCRGKV